MGTFGNIILAGILAGVVIFRKEIAETPLLIGQGLGGGFGAAVQPIRELFDYLAGLGCGVIRDCGQGMIGGVVPTPGGGGCYVADNLFACKSGYHFSDVLHTQCCPDTPTSTSETGGPTEIRIGVRQPPIPQTYYSTYVAPASRTQAESDIYRQGKRLSYL